VLPRDPFSGVVQTGDHAASWEIHDDAVEYVARQIGVDRTEIAFYDFNGLTSKAHRAQIRQALGFRECIHIGSPGAVAVRPHGKLLN
jgi:hypothetical protein